MKLNHHSLRVIRDLSGLSQTFVAEAAGIDRPNYAHIEAGRRKGTAAQITAIATAIGVPVVAICSIVEAEAAA